ncbi:HIT family protein [Corticicoccus populi]|uniref:HIT family protein n=1 Tax=Corticicoccus populi TaxID=1812821 RepID=A0ABW5WT76_9STAP
MIEIKELKVSRLYLNKDQTHRGRCILAFKDHKKEIFNLTEEERKDFTEDLSASAKALSDAFAPQKINYGIYGDLVSHLHMHLVPKYEGEKEWGSAFTNEPAEKKYVDENTYKELLEKIRINLTGGEKQCLR